MPLALDSTGPVVRITASGPVSCAEILELFQAMLKTRREGGAPVFVDTRNVSQAPSTAELRLIAREVKHLTDAGFGPIAVLTGSTWMYGVARMFSVFVQSLSDVVPLRSVQEADAWVDTQVRFQAAMALRKEARDSARRAESPRVSGPGVRIW